MSKVKILNTLQIQQKINRIAFEIYENNFSEKEIVVVGIDGNGYKFAGILVTKLKEISKIKITYSKLVINKQKPWDNEIALDIDHAKVANKTIILVDDVLNSGKTLMYAVKLFLDQPLKKLNTVVLVDRSHTNFPVKADFVGLRLSTTLQNHIEADFSKSGKEVVYLV
ncbi:MAG: phosphoribosyltransferase family protein [Bacteroidota bacterium]|jgi:pyrimidine operon attenuation protein/uracil phosphoribosyltransferase|nr:phosphoribosyltransferase [Bacteroidota bacterium]MCA6442145.1 phosphoribosyltransferase [Bacteroidota bacterium]